VQLIHDLGLQRPANRRVELAAHVAAHVFAKRLETALLDAERLEELFVELRQAGLGTCLICTVKPTVLPARFSAR
jgi:hypothetical protein